MEYQRNLFVLNKNSNDADIVNDNSNTTFFSKKFSYEKAAQWLELALDNVAFPLSELWEPTLVNLGHSLRKLK